MWLVGQCAAPVGASSRGSSRWDAFPRASNIYKSNAIPSRQPAVLEKVAHLSTNGV